MTSETATAIAHPNIAFIKYWGNRDDSMRIPSNGSISMNLAGLETRTTVQFDPALSADQLELNGAPAPEPARRRASAFLDQVRSLASLDAYAQVTSANNFPTGAGIASSASAFAALAFAASSAAGQNLDEPTLSRLARLGSGSASRSIPPGFVEWLPGTSDPDSFARSIASADHWDLVDCIAVLTTEHKPTGSTAGHSLAATSPIQAARVADAPRRLDLCRSALIAKDFDAFAEIVEQDSNLMHAVMLTSQPSLIYWQPETLAVMQAVQAWRREGLPACFTIDAGPNVHVISPRSAAEEAAARLSQLGGVQQVISAPPGGAARLVAS